MRISVYIHLYTQYTWYLPWNFYSSIKATQFRYILHRSSPWPSQYTWMHSIDHSGTELEASASSWWFIPGRIKIARSELGHKYHGLVNPELFGAIRGSIQLQRILSGCRLPWPPVANMYKLWWISNHIDYQVLDEITYQSPNFICTADEVWDGQVISPHTI